MAEDKDAEDKVFRQLVEIFLSVIITAIRMCGAFILYDIVIVPVFGAPPVTFWQAIGVWWFIKFILGFK